MPETSSDAPRKVMRSVPTSITLLEDGGGKVHDDDVVTNPTIWEQDGVGEEGEAREAGEGEAECFERRPDCKWYFP